MDELNTTSNIIRTIVRDVVLRNEIHCAWGMCAYLLDEKGYSPERLIQFATRTLHLPELAVIDFFDSQDLIQWN